MKTKHTPGPGSLRVRISAMDKHRIVEDMFGRTWADAGLNAEFANLVVAAPDLLNAVKDAWLDISGIDHGHGDDGTCGLCVTEKQLQAAIAKAEG